jgi:hypothetical protein
MQACKAEIDNSDTEFELNKKEFESNALIKQKKYTDHILFT